MKSDISKFSWKELFNNSDGKTSGSGFAGVILIAVCIISILNSNILIWVNPTDAINFLGQIVTIIVAASALLGVRKFVGKKKVDATIIDASINE